jgi:hypothetical protein
MHLMNERNLTIDFILLLIFSIMIFSITIILIIFDGIALSQPVIFCNGSNLWYYILVSIIITILLFLHNIFMNKDTKIGITKYFIYLSCGSGMLIWGGYELFTITCITNNILYKVSLVNWIILLAIYSTLFAYFIYSYFLKKLENNIDIIDNKDNNIIDNKDNNIIDNKDNNIKYKKDTFYFSQLV